MVDISNIMLSAIFKKLLNVLKDNELTDFTKLYLVEDFEKATGVKLNWKYAPRREGDIEKVWGNVDKANKVLGWKAEANIDDVLRSAWKWQLKLREEGIQ